MVPAAAGIFIVIGQALAFPLDSSPCPVLPAILSQPSPPHDHLQICHHQDSASALRTVDDRSLTNCLDKVLIYAGYLVTKCIFSDRLSYFFFHWYYKQGKVRETRMLWVTIHTGSCILRISVFWYVAQVVFSLQGSSSPRTARSLKMGRMCPESSVTNYEHIPRKIPDKRRIRLHHGGSPQCVMVLFVHISKWKEIVADDVALSVTDSTTVSYSACRDVETMYPNECRCPPHGPLVSGCLCAESASLCLPLLST
jgi:hypothetical protein